MLQKFCACHAKPLLTRLETCWNASATSATRNEATRSWKTRKRAPFAELSNCTAIRTSRGHLRTVANGCERLRTVANGCERLRTVANGCGHRRNVRRTQLYPHTPRVKREPLLRMREKPPLFWRFAT